MEKNGSISVEKLLKLKLLYDYDGKLQLITFSYYFNSYACNMFTSFRSKQVNYSTKKINTSWPL